MSTPEQAWNQLLTRTSHFLSTNNLEISGLDGKVAGNYTCHFYNDPTANPFSSHGTRLKFRVKERPFWRIQVVAPGKASVPNSYQIPQTCFYVPMFDATTPTAPVQTNATVNADAEVIVTGQLNGCTFAICGGGAGLSVAHIRPKGLGANAKDAKVAMSNLIRGVMPEQPTMHESSAATPVTIIGIKQEGVFRFYAQNKSLIGGRMITGITEF